MTQQDLFAPYNGKPPYQRDSVTSRQASESMEDAAPTVRERVFAYIKKAPRTNEEIELGLGIRIPTVCGRVRELALAGRIKDSGAKRQNRSGRLAVVWCVDG